MHHLKSWEEKVTHSYLQFQIKKNEQINLKETYGWLKSENFSSHVEGYLFSLQEQEINTRAAQKCWERNLDKRRNIDSRCRLCKQKMKIYSTLYHPVLHFQIVCTCITDMTMSERSYMKK